MMAFKQEISEYARQVSGVERKLAGWKSEVKVEVLEEVSGHFPHEQDRLKLDSLHREISQMAAMRIELESRIDQLKVEISSTSKMKPEMEHRLRDMEQALSTCLGDLESFRENLRSEVFSASSARVETLEARWQEAHQSLSRRFDAVQVGVQEDVKSTCLDVKKITSQLKRLEDEHGSIREDVAAEVRLAIAAIPEYCHDEGPLRAEVALKINDLGGKLNDLDSKLEQMEFELTTTRATRESFEYRVRDANAEAQQSVEVLRSELSALRTLLKQEQFARDALDQQLWETDLRLGQRIDDAVQSQRELLTAPAFEALRISRDTSPNGESKSPGAIAMARLAIWLSQVSKTWS